jgi:DNA-binding NarL/FixJ family response regulator
MEPIRVLLTDDHPIVRRGIRNLLEKAPDIVVVGEASNGEQALCMVEELAPDVMLLDMEMPGINGLEVARRLQAKKSPVRVLALSAYDDEQYILGLLKRDVVGYLTKEEALDTIVEAVRGVARGEEGWLSRRITAKVLRQRGEARNKEPEQDQAIPLTEREKAVLYALAQGWDNQRIAHELYVSERTVKFHTSNIYQKLQVTSRTGAILYAISRGWLDITWPTDASDSPPSDAPPRKP